MVLWPDGVSAVLELGAAVALPFRESKVGLSDLRLHYHTGVSRGGAVQPWDPAEAGGFLANFLQSPAALW